MSKHHRRGGHYPGHLRDTFLATVTAYVEWGPGEPEPTVEHEVNYVPRLIPISEACRLVWNCTDIVPGDAVDALIDAGLKFGKRTYASAARAMFEEIQRRTILRTAYHEAGHAVIARVLGILCGPASIQPDLAEGSAGHAIIGDTWETDARWEERGKFREHASVLRGRIMAVMAGAEAEAVFMGQHSVGDDDDVHWINAMLDDLLSDQDDIVRYAERLRHRTRHLLRRHADKVERVAAALIEKGKLTASEIDAITGLASDGPPQRKLPEAFRILLGRD
jgi:ATP-dependent Zn protease